MQEARVLKIYVKHEVLPVADLIIILGTEHELLVFLTVTLCSHVRFSPTSTLNTL